MLPSFLLCALATTACDIAAELAGIPTIDLDKVSAEAPHPSSSFHFSLANSLPEPMTLQMAGDTTPDMSAWNLALRGGFVTTEDANGPDEDIDFDDGFMLAAELGYLFPSDAAFYWTLGLEGMWNEQDSDDDDVVRDVTVVGLLVNGTAHFPFNDTTAFYAGAGLGVAWVDVGDGEDTLTNFDEEDGPFLAWQLRAGIEYNVSETWGLHGGYRYVNIDDVELDDNFSDASFGLETEQHVLELGVAFRL